MLPELDWDLVVEYICNGIKAIIPDKVKGVIIGLSGGLDSSVVAYLCVKALDSSRVLGLILPDSDVTPEVDFEDAILIAKNLGIEYRILDIKPIVEAFYNSLKFFGPTSKLAIGNLRARIRMCINYYFANLEGWLVAGSSDKSELLLGYFTKYGDGGCDFLPIASLYKTQVRKLAYFLEIPSRIVSKPSRPALWPGHLAEEELGYSYQFIDPILHLLVDVGLSPIEVSSRLNVDLSDVLKIKSMMDSTVHKRSFPKIIDIPVFKLIKKV
ncbi:MAG: NAD+ synthase [Candidatus Methanomethylicia archaeon]|nr:NAD+ synthase [Candidatus Methanomethylicia archaeon]